MNAIIETTLTMSSREIALLCHKAHRNVKRDFLNLCSELEIDALKFEHIYIDRQNRNQTEYWLDKDLTLTLVSGYKAKIRYAIVKRWRELEEGQKPQLSLSTKSDRVPLKDAVNMLVAKTTNLSYSDAYRLLHQKMGIESVTELTSDQVPVAVEYVHSLVVQATALQGELMPPEAIPEWETPEYKAQHRRGAVALMTIGLEMERKQSSLLRKLEAVLFEARDTLREAQKCNGAIFDGLHESQFHLCFETEIMKEGHKMGRERASLRDK